MSYRVCTTLVLGVLALSGCQPSQPHATTKVNEPAPAPAPAQAALPAAAATAGASRAPGTTSLSADRLKAVVDTLLHEQYPGGFDTAHACWKAQYGEGDEAMAYCMRPLPATAVTEAGEQAVYVASASAADIEDDANYRYGATDPGMFDAFRVVVAPDGNTTLSAAAKGMDFGSAGDCGCANADLVAIGPDIHGWVFSSGGTQQGITTATHSILAPVDGAFKDVASLPQYVEGQPDLEYRLAIGSDQPVDGWFPLMISKYRKDEKLASQTIRFDRTAQRYILPKTF